MIRVTGEGGEKGKKEGLTINKNATIGMREYGIQRHIDAINP